MMNAILCIMTFLIDEPFCLTDFAQCFDADLGCRVTKAMNLRRPALGLSCGDCQLHAATDRKSRHLRRGDAPRGMVASMTVVLAAVVAVAVADLVASVAVGLAALAKTMAAPIP